MNQLLSIPWGPRQRVNGDSGLHRRTVWSAATLAVLVVAGGNPAAVRAASEEGVALAIIYDTSGSMKELVPDRAGGSAPKYMIANRALLAVTDQIQTFATNASGGPRKIEAGLFVFQGDHAREAVKFGPFNPAALRDFARGFSAPGGNTPLGNALTAASQTVLRSPLSRKHVLIITDGMNTAGPTPSAVLPRLKQEAQSQGAALSVHFVAFDVDAKVFSSVKQLGATVVGAANEKQLDSQLQLILQKQILLEDEEAPAKH